MQRLLTLVTLIAASGLAPAPVLAMGFGKTTGATALGHPLNFAIALRLEGDESVEPGCVNATVVSGDRSLSSEQVRAQIERLASGERRIRVTTTVVIEEPVVQVNLRVGCPPSLSRSFTLFADPPTLLARTGDPELVDAMPQARTSPLEAIVSAAESSRRSSAGARGGVGSGEAVTSASPSKRTRQKDRDAASRPMAQASRADVAAQASQRPPAGAVTPPAPRKRAQVTSARPEARPTLRLDPLEAEEMVQPLLRMDPMLRPFDGSATAAASAPGLVASGPWSDDLDERARQVDAERIRRLEATLAQLRGDTQQKDKTLVDLTTRMRAAELDAHDNRWLIALGVLSVLLAAGLLWLLRLRQLDRRRLGWWADEHEAAAAAESAAPATSVGGVVSPAKRSVPGELDEPAYVHETPDSAFYSDRPQPVKPPSEAPIDLYPTLHTLANSPLPRESLNEQTMVVEPRRPMSAEELIDLEQQVEFFVVLGQDDAAIDLLMSHVRSTGGVSPLPYLKLLEIYRRRGEQEPYERIRERFNRRFNGFSPEWSVDPETGQSLQGHPEVLASIEASWDDPSRSMDLLDDLLFKRDAGPTFDVPAFRELLFLYGIARDLAERDVPESGVDLLLPFGEEEVVAHYSPATPTMQRVDEPLSLDLDVSTDNPPTLMIETYPDDHFDGGLDFTVDDEPPAKKPS
ncbi:MAG: hypothetical protein RLZZ618_4174 [Pseudomonadota bacterium]|jgi:hypothetical protein